MGPHSPSSTSDQPKSAISSKASGSSPQKLSRNVSISGESNEALAAQRDEPRRKSIAGSKTSLDNSEHNDNNNDSVSGSSERVSHSNKKSPKSQRSDASSAKIKTFDIISDGTREFRSEIGSDHERIFHQLRQALTEKELRARSTAIKTLGDSKALFAEKKNNETIVRLLDCQKAELAGIQESLAASRAAVNLRKSAIIFQMNLNATAESNDGIILESDMLHNQQMTLKNRMDDLRVGFEATVEQMKLQHVTMRKQLSRAQDREYQDGKALIEHETLNMSDDKRLSKMKSFQFKSNQQKNMNKRISEQLRQTQELEIRQAKERFELEIRIFDEMESLKFNHASTVQRTRYLHRSVVQQAEIEIHALSFSHKAALTDQHNRKELSRVAKRHRLELKLLKQQFRSDSLKYSSQLQTRLDQVATTDDAFKAENKIPLVFPPDNFGICSISFGLAKSNDFLRASHADAMDDAEENLSDIDFDDNGKNNDIMGELSEETPQGRTGRFNRQQTPEPSSHQRSSHSESRSSSRRSSINPGNDIEDIIASSRKAEKEKSSGTIVTSSQKGSTEIQPPNEAENPELIKKKLSQAEHDFKLLVARQEKDLAILVRKLTHQYSVAVANFQQQLFEQQEEHQKEIEQLHGQQLDELVRLDSAQQKEAAMEENVINIEKNMLIERKRLGMMFQAIVDGIIIIDVKGIIKTFNAAAEKIFGYTSAEIVGKNIHILQSETAPHHDNYISAYQTTGIKKVIGQDRKVHARKKNGELFWVSLAVSEIIDKDVHIFTAVVHDMTLDEKSKVDIAQEQAKRAEKFTRLKEDLKNEQTRSAELINMIVPAKIQMQAINNDRPFAEIYREATVLVTEIHNFGDIIESCSSEDILSFLNRLQDESDKVIEELGLLKVESVGDSITCVSGVPVHSNSHALDAAKAALLLQRVVRSLRLDSLPETQLRLKVGLHSGTVVAGIMGRKCPRFKVLGDTVYMACRMKSTADAGTVHMTSATRQILSNLPGNPCQIICKGETQVKGRDSITTFTLESIRGLSTTGSITSMSSLQKSGPPSNQNSQQRVPESSSTWGDDRAYNRM